MQFKGCIFKPEGVLDTGHNGLSRQEMTKGPARLRVQGKYDNHVFLKQFDAQWLDRYLLMEKFSDGDWSGTSLYVPKDSKYE